MKVSAKPLGGVSALPPTGGSPLLTHSRHLNSTQVSRSDSAAQRVRRSQGSLPSSNHGKYEVLVVFKARKDNAGHVKTDQD